MKNLVLLSTLLAAGLAQGCIISSGDDDGGGGVSPCGDLEQGGGGCVDVFVTCPSRATEFTVSGLDGDVTEDCAEGEVAIVVDAGTYDVTVTPFDGAVPFPSRTLTVRVDDFETAILDYEISAAEMELTWTIGDSSPSLASCDSLSGEDVLLFSTIAGTADSIEATWPCIEGAGITDPMELGDYVVVVQLLDEVGDPVGDNASEARNVSLEADGQVEDLGNFNFTL